MLNITNHQRNDHQYHKENQLTHVRLDIIKKITGKKYWWGCGEKGTLEHFWWAIYWYNCYGKQYGSFSKAKNRTTMWPSIAAATAAKSLQSCPTLCDLIDGSPPGSPIHGILQARTLEWVAISFSIAWKVKVKSLSRVRLLATPWTAAYQAPPSMGFSRQEYWSGLSLPSPVTQHYGVYIWKKKKKN